VTPWCGGVAMQQRTDAARAIRGWHVVLPSAAGATRCYTHAAHGLCCTAVHGDTMVQRCGDAAAHRCSACNMGAAHCIAIGHGGYTRMLRTDVVGAIRRVPELRTFGVPGVSRIPSWRSISCLEHHTFTAGCCTAGILEWTSGIAM
jgi:hypothetical protein